MATPSKKQKAAQKRFIEKYAKKKNTKKKNTKKKISKDKIENICKRCKTKYAPKDNFCRKCGRLRKRSDRKRQRGNTKESTQETYYGRM
jgi:uncharacterized OB-fold protein